MGCCESKDNYQPRKKHVDTNAIAQFPKGKWVGEERQLRNQTTENIEKVAGTGAARESVYSSKDQGQDNQNYVAIPRSMSNPTNKNTNLQVPTTDKKSAFHNLYQKSKKHDEKKLEEEVNLFQSREVEELREHVDQLDLNRMISLDTQMESAAQIMNLHFGKSSSKQEESSTQINPEEPSRSVLNKNKVAAFFKNNCQDLQQIDEDAAQDDQDIMMKSISREQIIDLPQSQIHEDIKQRVLENQTKDVTFVTYLDPQQEYNTDITADLVQKKIDQMVDKVLKDEYDQNIIQDVRIIETEQTNDKSSTPQFLNEINQKQIEYKQPLALIDQQTKLDQEKDETLKDVHLLEEIPMKNLPELPQSQMPDVVMKHFKAEIQEPNQKPKQKQAKNQTLDFKLNFNTITHKITGIVDLVGGALVEGEFRVDATKYFKLIIKSPHAHLHIIEGQIMQEEFGKLDGIMYDIKDTKKRGQGKRIIMNQVQI
eukprot:403358155